MRCTRAESRRCSTQSLTELIQFHKIISDSILKESLIFFAIKLREGF
jgi:hypothetical protein